MRAFIPWRISEDTVITELRLAHKRFGEAAVFKRGRPKHGLARATSVAFSK